jgi:hypothetical protein
MSTTNITTTDTDWREDGECSWRRAGLLTLQVAPSYSDLPWRWSVSSLGTTIESGRVASADEGKAKAEAAARIRGETIVNALAAEAALPSPAPVSEPTPEEVEAVAIYLHDANERANRCHRSWSYMAESAQEERRNMARAAIALGARPPTKETT